MLEGGLGRRVMRHRAADYIWPNTKVVVDVLSGDTASCWRRNDKTILVKKVRLISGVPDRDINKEGYIISSEVFRAIDLDRQTKRTNKALSGFDNAQEGTWKIKTDGLWLYGMSSLLKPSADEIARRSYPEEWSLLRPFRNWIDRDLNSTEACVKVLASVLQKDEDGQEFTAKRIRVLYGTESAKHHIIVEGYISSHMVSAATRMADDAMTKGQVPSHAAWPQPRFTDMGDGTVKDNLTGLVWLRNANLCGLKSWQDAADYCQKLSKGGVEGLIDDSHPGDWRLPTKNELIGLTCAEFENPAVPNKEGAGKWTGDPFSNIQSDSYWSATPHQDRSDFSWLVGMDNGCLAISERGKYDAYVWPLKGVRSQ
ncbi:MAG: DUF1566 domain-containing protein [Verrucomicrobia bacterium]|nr:DUF1566 domain-containing protein [Verrucomicrobiota bacterium]